MPNLNIMSAVNKVAGAAKSVGGSILKTGVQGVLGALEVNAVGQPQGIPDTDLHTDPRNYSESALPKRDTAPLGVAVPAMPVLQPVRVGTNDVFAAIKQVERNVNVVNQFAYGQIKKQSAAITRVDRKISAANKDFDFLSRNVKDLTQATLDNKRALDKLLKKSPERVTPTRLQQEEDEPDATPVSSGDIASSLASGALGAALLSALKKLSPLALLPILKGAGLLSGSGGQAESREEMLDQIKEQNKAPEAQSAQKKVEEYQKKLKDLEDKIKSFVPADPGPDARVEPLERGKAIDRALGNDPTNKTPTQVGYNIPIPVSKDSWSRTGNRIKSLFGYGEDDGVRPKEEEFEKGGGDSQTDARAKATEEFGMTRADISFTSTVSDIIFDVARDFKVKAEGMIKIEGKTITLDAPNIIFTSKPKIQNDTTQESAAPVTGEYGPTGKGGVSPVFRHGIGGNQTQQDYHSGYGPTGQGGSSPVFRQGIGGNRGGGPSEPPGDDGSSTPGVKPTSGVTPKSSVTPGAAPQAAAPPAAPEYTIDRAKTIAALRQHEPRLQGLGSMATDDQIWNGLINSDEFKNSGISVQGNKLIGDPAKIDATIKGMKEKYPGAGADIDSAVSKSTPAPAPQATQQQQQGSRSKGGGDIGKLSAAYESGGRPGDASADTGPGGKPAGWSYGAWQFNSQGNLSGYLKDNPDIAKQLKGTPGSAEFTESWKALAAKDPEGFKDSQRQYAMKELERPGGPLEHAKGLGFNTDNRGVYEAIWSGTQQHGGIKKVLNAAASDPNFKNLSPQDQIKAFYAARANYTDNLKIIPAAGRDRYYARGEQDAALKLANEDPKNNFKGQQPQQGQPQQGQPPGQFQQGQARPSWLPPGQQQQPASKVEPKSDTNQQLGATPGQKDRPYHIGGNLKMGDETYVYGSGGANRGSAPYGRFPVGNDPNSRGSWGKSHGGIDINSNTINDPKYPGRPRAGILLHASSGSDIDNILTEGCLGIPRKDFARFKAGLQEKIRKEGPQVLTINEDQSASIDPAGKSPPTTTTKDFIDEHKGKGVPLQPNMEPMLSTKPEMAYGVKTAQQEKGTAFGDRFGAFTPPTAEKVEPKPTEAAAKPVYDSNKRLDEIEKYQKGRDEFLAKGGKLEDYPPLQSYMDKKPQEAATKLTPQESDVLKQSLEQKGAERVKEKTDDPAPEPEKPKTMWESIKQGASDLYDKIPTPGAAKEAIQEKVTPDLKPVATPVEREPESKIPSDWKDPEPDKEASDKKWSEVDTKIPEGGEEKMSVGKAKEGEGVPHTSTSGADEPSGRREPNPPSRDIQRHSTSHNPDSRKPTPNDNGEGRNRNSPDGVGLCSITA